MEKATDPEQAARERLERPNSILAAASQRPVLLATRLAARQALGQPSSCACIQARVRVSTVKSANMGFEGMRTVSTAGAHALDNCRNKNSPRTLAMSRPVPAPVMVSLS